MIQELEDRLAAYRPALDAAITDDVRRRAARPSGSRLTLRWATLAVAGGAVAACVAALWVVTTDRAPEVAPTLSLPLPTLAEPTPPTMQIVLPQTTAAPAPASSVTTTNVAQPAPIVAIGDSVMLGAADELFARGILVDTAESRQMLGAVVIAEGLRELDEPIAAAVIHLGTNGPISVETVDRLFNALSAIPKVIVLTAHADRQWISPVNEQLRQVPQRFSNVVLVDWDALAATCPGDCFHDDGIHLRQDGQTYYAQVIAEALGL